MSKFIPVTEVRQNGKTFRNDINLDLVESFEENPSTGHVIVRFSSGEFINIESFDPNIELYNRA